MTADERIEALLNRCGQTISDLPRSYSVEQKVLLRRALKEKAGLGYFIHELDYETEILNMNEVIDRMELALDNLLTGLDRRNIPVECLLDMEEGSS